MGPIRQTSGKPIRYEFIRPSSGSRSCRNSSVTVRAERSLSAAGSPCHTAWKTSVIAYLMVIVWGGEIASCLHAAIWRVWRGEGGVVLEGEGYTNIEAEILSHTLSRISSILNLSHPIWERTANTHIPHLCRLLLECYGMKVTWQDVTWHDVTQVLCKSLKFTFWTDFWEHN